MGWALSCIKVKKPARQNQQGTCIYSLSLLLTADGIFELLSTCLPNNILQPGFSLMNPIFLSDF